MNGTRTGRKEQQHLYVSTPRVKQHRENQKLLVKMPFANKICIKFMRWRFQTEKISKCCRHCRLSVYPNVEGLCHRPKSTMELLQSITPSPVSQDIQPLQELNKKRDKVSNAARKLIVKGVSKNNPRFHHQISKMYTAAINKSVE